MSDKLLVVKNLVVDLPVQAEVGEYMDSPVQKSVVKGISLEVGKGEVVLITGANGEGKSTLAQALIGNPKYKIRTGKIMWGGKDLLAMSINERSRAGLHLVYQNPVEIPGVKVFTMCKTMYEVHGNKIESVVEFRKKLEELAERVGLTKEYVVREVNTGFSGGEKKRLELLQILLLQPKLVMLDEVDSGLDKEGRKMVREVVRELVGNGVGVMVISHNEKMWEEVEIGKRMVMKEGKLWEKV